MKNSGKNIVIIILALVCVGLLILLVDSGSEKPSGFEPTQNTEDNNTITIPTSDFYSDKSNDREETTRTETTTIPKTTETTPTTQTQKPSGNTVLIAEGLYVIRNTPNNKGAKMMNLATSSSTVKGTLAEGTVVRVLSDNTSNKTGYVQVLAYKDPMDEHCFIKKEYLTFKEYPNHYSPPTSNTRYVSYNTPAHAGINMRTAPSSSAELVVLLSEGTPVFIAEPYSSSNHGYIKVGCEEFPSGEPLYGWVLYDYLVR